MSAANVSFTSAKLGLRIQNHDCGNCGRRNREARTANSESRIQNRGRSNGEARVANSEARIQYRGFRTVAAGTVKPEPRIQSCGDLQNQNYEARTMTADTMKPE